MFSKAFAIGGAGFDMAAPPSKGMQPLAPLILRKQFVYQASADTQIVKGTLRLDLGPFRRAVLSMGRGKLPAQEVHFDQIFGAAPVVSLRVRKCSCFSRQADEFVWLTDVSETSFAFELKAVPAPKLMRPWELSFLAAGRSKQKIGITRFRHF